MTDGGYGELALLLVISAGVGVLAVRLRQPLLVAYILAGVLAGPAVFGWVDASDQIDLLAQIGLTVLLFLVGLKLDLHHVRHIGPVAVATGLGQLGFTILIGFIIVLALGNGWLEAVYVAVALTFSSTIIVVKLLSDKRELDTLHGRIALGVLIVQDIAVVIAMMTMSALNGADTTATPAAVAVSLLLRVGTAGMLLFVMMRHVLPWAVHRMARSQELLLIFAIAWGTTLASLGEWAGFSKEAGAFLAGFSLASTAYREAISARLTSIRDFLLLFFFVELGSKLNFSLLQGEIWPALVLSAFVLVGKPLVVMAIMGYMGYRKRTGLLAGLAVAQISEFSIIFVAMGVALGHVTERALGLTTLVGLITITLSTYLILYSQHLHERLARWLTPFERRTPFRELVLEQVSWAVEQPQIIIFGLGRYGSRLLRRLRDAGIATLGVDFDPDRVRMLRSEGLPVLYGDAEDQDFIGTLPLPEAAWVVCALPLPEPSRVLLHALGHHGYRGHIAAIVRDDAQAGTLQSLGVEWFLNPFTDAADYTAQRLRDALGRADR